MPGIKGIYVLVAFNYTEWMRTPLRLLWTGEQVTYWVLRQWTFVYSDFIKGGYNFSCQLFIDCLNTLTLDTISVLFDEQKTIGGRDEKAQIILRKYIDRNRITQTEIH